jgi:subtilase family serine protease
MSRLTSVLVTAAFATVFFVAASQAASSDRAVLAGSVPAWANSQHVAGTASPSGVVGFRVYLGWQNVAAAESLARAVSDPRSTSYGHYLTPAQFRQRFAPSQSQIGAVQSWLRSQGFTINHTPLNNHYVSATGTVAQAQAAFHTTFKM